MNDQSSRRDLFRKSVLAAAGVAAAGRGGVPAWAAGQVGSGGAEKKAVLKLSSQEGAIPGENLAERLDNIERMGFDGLEVGGGGLPKRVKELKDAVQGRPIKLTAVCAGFKGCILSEKKEER
ncbi:MAG: sugar phosphate isomerase/epimerase, partial [Planctomycetota bacterium]